MIEKMINAENLNWIDMSEQEEALFDSVTTEIYGSVLMVEGCADSLFSTKDHITRFMVEVRDGNIAVNRKTFLGKKEAKACLYQWVTNSKDSEYL